MLLSSDLVMRETLLCLRRSFTADWANDLILVKTQEKMWFPRNNGLPFNHVWGKSLRDGSANLSGIRRHSDLYLCPVKAMEPYIAISSVFSIDLLLVSPSAFQGRSKISKLLTPLCSRDSVTICRRQIYNRETLHSFIAGLAIT